MSNLDPQTEAKAQAKAAKAYAKAARPWHKKKRTWLLGGAAVLVVSAMFSGGGESGTATDDASAASTQTQEAQATPTAVTAGKMLDALTANALKAKSTYEGKYLKITGKVYNIDASGDYFSVDGLNDDFTLTGIMMNINDDHLAQVQEFEVGQTVTVIGTVTDVGELLGYSVDVESIV